jgi:hypothetical protein
MITRYNYYTLTSVTFKGCKTPKRKPDYISYSKYVGGISSRYWYGKDYVIRESDHWTDFKDFSKGQPILGCGGISSCLWSLRTNNPQKMKSGKAFFKDFKKTL